jgi:hypothetical protein
MFRYCTHGRIDEGGVEMSGNVTAEVWRPEDHVKILGVTDCPTPIDILAEHMMEMERECGESEVGALSWIDATEELKEQWRVWTRAAISGATEHACGVGFVAFYSVRLMAQGLELLGVTTQ